MRKLVSIQEVINIDPIPNSDFLEAITVLGWTLVAKKGEFVIGSPCVFFEVDCLLPEAPWSEFLRSKKFRIKTVKLRGQLSQGLALPLEYLGISPGECEIGDDVTERLGVKKYELPENEQPGNNAPVLGIPFPSHVPKTDEPRVQSNPDLLQALAGRPYVTTVKLDGSSFTATYDSEGTFHVCSRNLSLFRPEEGGLVNNWWKVAIANNLEEKLQGTTYYAIQGELCGPGIQKNRLNLTEHRLFVFNAYNWEWRRHLTPVELQDLCERLGLDHVPVDETGDSFSYTAEELLAKADGVYAGTKNRREGIVVRSNDGGSRVSIKAISNDFLLKDEL
jgi:RNA ligase (TIGR02306 family)